MIRIATPPTVDWYDVDFPSVIAARELSLPSRANVHGISADLTTPDWLDAVPTDRPAVIVADGLMAFLSKDEMVSLLNRLTSHFPGGDRLQQLHQVHHPGGQTLARHPVGCGSRQIARVR